MNSHRSASIRQRLFDRSYLLRLFFGLSEPVGRIEFIASGFGLMFAKYVCEAAMIYWLTDRFYPPWDFLNPLISVREKYFQPPAPDWLLWFVILWSLPFLWIAVSMSVRRAADSGLSAWLGLLVFVPLANLFVMAYLCFPKSTSWKPAMDSPSGLRPQGAPIDEPMLGTGELVQSPQPLVEHRVTSALLGIAASALICILMVSVSVYLIGNYGAALFMGTPIIMGATSSYIYNRPYSQGVFSSILIAELSVLLSGMILLLFAFEGILCLAMLLPIAAMMAILGALIGVMIAKIQPQQSLTFLVPISFLPVLAGAEHIVKDVPEYEVLTTIEIEASPEEVWPNVVGFSELDDPPSWFFQLGIAYPKRATIIGSGIGAVRHCEFSTGPFIEPITVWDPPARLAFDVRSQPAPMHELSPYRHVHPPHLDGYLRCKRGEFRLIDLKNGRTRLEGRTWYEYEVFPQSYWTLWTDILIHRIHIRVLNHIKKLSEH